MSKTEEIEHVTVGLKAKMAVDGGDRWAFLLGFQLNLQKMPMSGAADL